MVCVYCGAATQVVNSRHQRRSNDIWRRRKCTACGTVFTSIESADLASALRVERSQGQLEPFVRDKLFLSIYESCGHRPTALRDAANLTNQVIHRLISRPGHHGLIARSDIIDMATAILKPFDRAASTAYLAYHPL
jgi:transcriptional regulator NrdR family protein